VFQEAEMVLKNLFAALLGAAVLAGSGAMAAEYRPDDFLTLDLSKAVMSPIPLGPPAQFAPVPVQGKSDQTAEAAPPSPAAPSPPPAAAPSPQEPAKLSAQEQDKTDVAEPVSVTPPQTVVHARAAKPRGAARARLAQRRGNPLNAQARDTRIQSWPCKPHAGGICAWKQ
jgi:hypothetical protein